MAVLNNFAVIFCLFLCWSDSYCIPFENNDGVNSLKHGATSLIDLCLNYGRSYATERKILCVFCKGLDLSCFVRPTTTTTSSTPASTTTTATTATTTTTTTPSTTSTTTTATAAADDAK